MAKRIRLDKSIVTENDRLAAVLAHRYDDAGILAVNLMSSPGSGKTTLLEETARALGGRFRMACIEGDLATDHDARRIERAGMPCQLINTGGGCHLNAGQVGQALDAYRLEDLDIVFIENVGNLVCPAAFDLGEHRRVVVSSTPEGDDKPAKYPVAFRLADCVVLNKIDLVGATDFSVEAFRRYLAGIKADLPVLELSCKTGEGLAGWFQWVTGARDALGRPARSGTRPGRAAPAKE
ncbi:MAG: hydrogenase nickel incorporation protein HypB [Planctomycetes bacterium]|nr:hydrogenase nickel incorporation protein HypB [Planctomycetota bacterium]